jgi:hypothetical protein
VSVLHALLLTWSLLPLAAMLVALGAASYLRQSGRESGAAEAPLPRDSSD